MHKKNRFSWLLSPQTIGVSIMLGVLYGYFLKPYVSYVEPIGEIFLALLEMCVLPLIVSAVTSSFARLLKTYKTHGNKQILLLPVYFVFGMLVVSAVAIALAQFGNIGGNVSEHTRVVLGKAILAASQHFHVGGSEAAVGAHSMISSLVTANIAKAAVEGQGVPLLIFSTLLGLALGLVTSRAGDATLLFFDGVFESMLKLVSGVIYLLPIGLFCLLAQQVSYMGLNVFLPLASLILYFFALATVIAVICVSVIALRTRLAPWEVLLKLREALTVGFVSSSSFSALPFALNSLERKFKFDRDDVNIILPLGVSLNFLGSTILFASMAIFMMHFYGHALTLSAYAIILFGSMFTSIAIGSIPAISGFSLVSIIFYPLGLPVKSTVIILVLMSQFIDPIMTSVNLLGNVMITVLLSRKRVENNNDELDAGRE